MGNCTCFCDPSPMLLRITSAAVGGIVAGALATQSRADGFQPNAYVWGDGMEAPCAIRAGELYVWRNPSNGNASTLTPSKVASGYNISKVACSKSRMHALGSNGRLYVASLNETDGGKKTVWTQCKAAAAPPGAAGKVSSPDRSFVDISVGDFHAVAVGSSGRVYSIAEMVEEDSAEWSSDNSNEQPQSPVNRWGQLPTGKRGVIPVAAQPVGQRNADRNDTFEEVSVPLTVNPHVVRAACGANHTLLLTDGGNVFAFGCNIFSQLGVGTIMRRFDLDDPPCECSPAPILVPGKKQGLPAGSVVVDVHAGGDSSALVIRTPQPSPRTALFTFGEGHRGTHGLGTFKHSVGEPALVKSISNKTFFSESAEQLRAQEITSVSVGRG